TRIWTADPQHGVFTLTIDGNTAPALRMPFLELFHHLPLSFGLGGESSDNYERSASLRKPMGHTSYCPIPFRKGCKITIDPEDDYLYYQINYHLFPAGTAVESFDAAAPAQREWIRRAERAWAGWEAGDSPVDWDAAHGTEIRLAPGERAEIFRDTTGGVIHGLRLMLPAAPDERAAAHIRENVRRVARFDDDERRDPSVLAPVGPFFMDFGERPAARSLYVGTDMEGTYYCTLPMPYGASASLELDNRSLLPLEGARFEIVAGPAVEPAARRFKAAYHVETPFGPNHRDYDGVACRLLNQDGRHNFELLRVRGAGHFVGCAFHADLRDSPTDRAACEGDEMFFVDDDPALTMNGTGTEDYLNDAWALRGYCSPLSGDALQGTWGENPQLYGYRLHLTDYVPFQRNARFTLEHGTGNNCSGLYRSVAYWYQSPESERVKVEERRWQDLRSGG
ncbi:MAG TPA: glycoside hydrolase family 172 protein, partial [Chthonomonadales bacterium]|nr:glycoside hydrolase family 172 protein [Chthonomonadales bacterium]